MYAKKQKNSRKIDEHQSFEEQIFGFHENETLKSINVCFFKKKYKNKLEYDCFCQGCVP